MATLGAGLFNAGHYTDALRVEETIVATMRRLGAPETQMLVVQGNLALTYKQVGRPEESLLMHREVYHGHLKLDGEEHTQTLREAFNYAISLVTLRRFEEARSLLRKTMPVARRVLGDNHELTLRTRTIYAQTLYADASATLDDLREAVKTLEDTDRIARRVFGGSHPLVGQFERALREARTFLRAREAGKSVVSRIE